MNDHICTVCRQSFRVHAEKCECGQAHWPGCPKIAQAEIERLSGAAWIPIVDATALGPYWALDDAMRVSYIERDGYGWMWQKGAYLSPKVLATITSVAPLSMPPLPACHAAEVKP